MKDYIKMTIGLSLVTVGMTMAYTVGRAAGDKLGKLFAKKAKVEIKKLKEKKTES